MRGKHVILRTLGDVPRAARVWEETAEVVYITSESGYRKLNDGDDSVMPIGFRREDVFEYDGAGISELKNASNGLPCNWQNLHKLKTHSS